MSAKNNLESSRVENYDNFQHRPMVTDELTYEPTDTTITSAITERFIGIDAGTTNYCSYLVTDAEIFGAIPIYDPNEGRTTPSAIAFQLNDHKNPVNRWFGHAAVRMVGKKHWVVVRNWKRLINQQ